MRACVWLARITPACAGKTHKVEEQKIPFWDHPRMRGEDRRERNSSRAAGGSPPHARGRRAILIIREIKLRITPACAGKTYVSGVPDPQGPDHPRMRGEDVPIVPSPAYSIRITPACAGKTFSAYCSVDLGPDHPRMRGEDNDAGERVKELWGSPPHARGRLGRLVPRNRLYGITPACAGKTFMP